jgi:signal transduction histidine kinase
MSHSDSRPHTPANDDAADASSRLRAEVADLKARAADHAARALAQQDADRLRIARDLHDTLGQYFTVLALELNTLRREAVAHPAIEAAVARIATLSETARRDVDQLAWEIRPPELNEQGGLARAIPHLLGEWSARTGAVFQSHIAIGTRRFTPVIETTLFRVLQEAIRNVVNHAGATRAGVILQAHDRDLSLTIEDDGVGFDLREEGAMNADDGGGQGLRGARERLALVGGTLEVETTPGRGTTLLIHVPL